MGNIYGVQNEGSHLANQGIGADVVCPAGTDTTVYTLSFNFPMARGNWQPLMLFNCGLSLGATPPTQVAFHTQVNGGSNTGIWNLNNLVLVANANLFISGMILSLSSAFLWSNPGTVLTLSCNPTGQPVTVRTVGFVANTIWFRGLDSYT